VEKRPFDVLEQAKGKRVMIRLKNGEELVGTLKAFDMHLNIWLDDAERHEEQRKVRLGTVVLRGDNILLISP